MNSIRRKLRWIAAAMVLSGLAAIAIVSLAGASDGTPPKAGSATPYLAPMTFSEQASLYPALARSMTAQDANLSASAEVMAASGVEESEPIVMDPGKVRRIDSVPGADIGIMPSQTGVCILVSFAPGEVTGSCSPRESIEVAGLNVGFDRGDEHYAIGAVPSTWSTKVSVIMGNGRQESIWTNEDGGYAFVTDEPVAEILVTDERGVEHPVLRERTAGSPAPPVLGASSFGGAP